MSCTPGMSGDVTVFLFWLLGFGLTIILVWCEVVCFAFFVSIFFVTLREKSFKISLSVWGVVYVHFLMLKRPGEISSENKELESSSFSSIN